MGAGVRFTTGAPLFAALLLFCARPGPPAPSPPSGPDTLSQRKTGTFGCFHAEQVVLRIRYVVDWGDFSSDTGPELRLGDTARFTRGWQATGTFAVRCLALTEDGRRSDWSASKPVVVTNLAPQTPGTPLGPDSLRADSLGEFAARSLDPEGDLLHYVFDWGDGTSDVTPEHASGDTARLLHAWSATGEHGVRVRAIDRDGHESGWSAPRPVVVLP